MTDLITFLRARLDDDQAQVRQHPEAEDRGAIAPWEIAASTATGYPSELYLRIARARVLAEVEAKRRLIRRYENAVAVHTALTPYTRGEDHGYREACLDAIRDYAEIYADHPDYHQEWRQ